MCYRSCQHTGGRQYSFFQIVFALCPGTQTCFTSPTYYVSPYKPTNGVDAFQPAFSLLYLFAAWHSIKLTLRSARCWRPPCFGASFRPIDSRARGHNGNVSNDGLPSADSGGSCVRKCRDINMEWKSAHSVFLGELIG